jgi:DNA adenine methylase
MLGMSTMPRMRGSVPMNPFLKWVGGKRQLLPEIMKHVPASYGRYWEPFVGGGALFFHLTHVDLGHAATLIDTNEELIRTYTAVRDEVENVIEKLSTYPYESAFYYRMRASFPACEAACAARMIYLNKAGFNGLYRVNRQGKFNVPFGRYTNPTICDAATLRTCSLGLQNTTLRFGDFALSMRDVKKGDFVYFDPPYVPLTATSNFTQYAKTGFGTQDQARLRDVALTLKRRGITVLLSNSSAPLVRELYGNKKDFTLHEVDARRAVNSDAKKRGTVKELLIT